MLTPSQYDFLRSRLSAWMVPDAYPVYTLCNIYYDTPDYLLIRKSLEKPVYKEKLRLRSYGVPREDSQVFVELKKKFHGVVYKRRTVTTPGAAMMYLAGQPLPEEDQICHEIDWFRDRWKPEPRVFIAYDREALADREGGELRVTFDTGLRWRTDSLDLRSGDAGMPLLSPEDILMEIKIPGTAPLWLAHLLSEARALPTNFSKYGACYRRYLSRSAMSSGAGANPGKAVNCCA